MPKLLPRERHPVLLIFYSGGGGGRGGCPNNTKLFVEKYQGGGGHCSLWYTTLHMNALHLCRGAGVDVGLGHHCEAGVHRGRLVDVEDKVGILDEVDPKPQWEASTREEGEGEMEGERGRGEGRRRRGL